MKVTLHSHHTNSLHLSKEVGSMPWPDNIWGKSNQSSFFGGYNRNVYLVSDARLRWEECASTQRERESSTTWVTIRVWDWANTTGPASEGEQRPLFRVRDWADIVGPASEGEQKPPFMVQDWADTAGPASEGEWKLSCRVRGWADHGLRCTPAGEVALVHWTGYGESLLN